MKIGIYAVCPFYKGYYRKTIYCEFKNKTFTGNPERNSYCKNNCCSMDGMKQCKRYIVLMQRYDTAG